MEKYKGKYAEVYVPSEKFLEKWKRLAKEARMPLSSWIFATVEAAVDGLSENSEEQVSQGEALRAENRKLRKDHERSEARIRELETEVFNLRHGSVLAQTSGEVQYSARLVQIICSGGTWHSRDLLAELGIIESDADSIEIVTQQLHAMQDAGLVVETARGWKWTK